MYGERFFQVARLFGTTVHVNLESIAIMLATALAGGSLLEGALIVASFAIGTGLHLGCHWLVAIAFGKGIDRMILTRQGRIDYSGAAPGFAEGIIRTSAGPSMNAFLAAAGYGAMHAFGTEFSPLVALAVGTFARCNLILAAINFLPAIPFDGGLILRMILGRVLGDVRAERASAISIALLCGMAALGAWTRQPVPIYLAATIGYDVWRAHLRGSDLGSAQSIDDRREVGR